VGPVFSAAPLLAAIPSNTASASAKTLKPFAVFLIGYLLLGALRSSGGYHESEVSF
jgi:hypothetical protein